MANSKKHILKNILISSVSIILGVVVIGLVVVYFYTPRYFINEKPLDTSETHSGITIMSANVRTYTPTDFFKRSWFYRAKLFNLDIEQVNPDIICFQEATPTHFKYFTKVLEGYSGTITYRDESKSSEGCPIFYKTSLFDLVDEGHFWLSETPDKISISWNSAYYRICSYVILKEKESGINFVVFNTHLDSSSEEARINGIKLVLSKINEFGGYRSFLMGDFNDFLGSDTLNYALSNFLDSQAVADVTDDGCTYQDWGEKLYKGRIDFIMISRTGIKVNLYNILQKEETSHKNEYSSDHYPIYINVSFQ